MHRFRDNLTNLPPVIRDGWVVERRMNTTRRAISARVASVHLSFYPIEQ